MGFCFHTRLPLGLGKVVITAVYPLFCLFVSGFTAKSLRSIDDADPRIMQVDN
jgi:hypothetical protein